MPIGSTAVDSGNGEWGHPAAAASLRIRCTPSAITVVESPPLP